MHVLRVGDNAYDDDDLKNRQRNKQAFENPAYDQEKGNENVQLHPCLLSVTLCCNKLGFMYASWSLQFPCFLHQEVNGLFQALSTISSNCQKMTHIWVSHLQSLWKESSKSVHSSLKPLYSQYTVRCILHESCLPYLPPKIGNRIKD